MPVPFGLGLLVRSVRVSRFTAAIVVLFALVPSTTAGAALPEWWEDMSQTSATGAAAAEGQGHRSEGPLLEEELLEAAPIGAPSAVRPTDDDIAARVLRRPSGAGSRYGMQPGDVLQISVWREAELEREVEVSPDGFIAYPLIGEVAVSGLSIEEVRVEIVRRLKEFVPRAVVTVSLKEMRGNRVYVLGKVNRPGVFPFFDSLDVMQALSLAGGGARFAELEHIKIIRRDGDQQRSIQFDYLQVQRGERLDQNIQLRSGDTVLVP